MAKPKSVWVCQECGHEVAKWSGRCSGCGNWNCLEEEVREGGNSSSTGPKRSTSPLSLKEPVQIGDVDVIEEERLCADISELDRVSWGAASCPAAWCLLGGDPGIGKSTLALQVAGELFAEA